MIKLALPTGRLRTRVGNLLQRAGLPVQGYGEGSRSYRPSLDERQAGLPAELAGSPESVGPVRLRVFRERDIPVQIALGNYDLGICSLAWVEELVCRYPSEALVPLRDLGVGRARLFVAAAPGSGGLRAWAGRWGVRIVSEYPHLAEALAMSLRLPGYRVLPVKGAAEAYPPEDADLAVLTAAGESGVRALGLEPLHCLLESSAWLVASRRSLAGKDLSPVLGPLLRLDGPLSQGRTRLRRGRVASELALPRALPGDGSTERAGPIPRRRVAEGGGTSPADGSSAARKTVRLALPDGHQQPHAAACLAAAGLRFTGYDEKQAVRRPQSELQGLEAKVIRPQDMPQQVALGNFDLALTGRDWLLDHLYRFPDSPVQEVVDMGTARYQVLAVVSQDLPADTLSEAIAHWRGSGRSVIRVASEYPGVADHFARTRHLGRYRLIPISGASEGFVPEDADLLVEGSETGKTLAANRLKPLERLFESTTCVIAGRGAPPAARAALVERLVDKFREGRPLPSQARRPPAKGGAAPARTVV